MTTVRSTNRPGLGRRCTSSFQIVPINGVTTAPDLANERSYPSSEFPAQAIIHPDGLDFYVINSQSLEGDYPQDPLIFTFISDNGNLSAHRFDATGLMASATGPSVTLGAAPRTGAIDSNVTRLIVVDQGGTNQSGVSLPGDLRVLDITDPQRPAPLSTYPAIVRPYAIAASPTAPIVYVTATTGAQPMHCR